MSSQIIHISDLSIKVDYISGIITIDQLCRHLLLILNTNDVIKKILPALAIYSLDEFNNTILTKLLRSLNRLPKPGPSLQSIQSFQLNSLQYLNPIAYIEHHSITHLRQSQ